MRQTQREKRPRWFSGFTQHHFYAGNGTQSLHQKKVLLRWRRQSFRLRRDTICGKSGAGFTLLESLLAIAVLALVAQAIYSFTRQTIAGARATQAWSLASSIATEQLELIRNTHYENVGTVGGLPAGVFPQTQTISRGNIAFTVHTVVKEFDDPYDGNAQGTIPGKPRDTVPADYKKAEVNVCWDTLSCLNPLRFSTNVAPKNLESASNSGALFITVIDADAQPVPTVTIRVQNSAVVPAIDATNTTDVNGKLQLLSLPPSVGTYHVIGSKTGYTGDATVAPSPGNPNPVNPDTTVVVGGVTEVTLTVDLVSTVTVTTQLSGSCGLVPDLPVRLTGERLIGTNPDVLRNNLAATTNGSGVATFSNIEWDRYAVSIVSNDYVLAGSNPPSPVQLAAGTSLTLQIFLSPTATTSLLVSVLDAGTGLPVADATVRVEGNGFDETKTTNQGALRQTDWSGGSGQAAFTDPTRYFADDGNMRIDLPGEISLRSETHSEIFTENFNTTTYRDAAATTADWTTSPPYRAQLPGDPENPGQYLASAVVQSTKVNAVDGLITDVRVTSGQQLNGQEIQYFVAADGVSFEPVERNATHPFVSAGTDLRWKAVLSTDDPDTTPSLNEVVLHYTQIIRLSPDGWLESSTFDTGGQSTYSAMTWDPQVQPQTAGPDALRLQIATNADGSGWTFVGSDGTAGSFYTVSGTTLSGVHTSDRYLRYRVSLHTDDLLVTSVLRNISVVYTNSCLPPGQAFFAPLPGSGDYTVTVERTGYQENIQTVTVSGQTQVTILLSPA